MLLNLMLQAVSFLPIIETFANGSVVIPSNMLWKSGRKKGPRHRRSEYCKNGWTAWRIVRNDGSGRINELLLF